MFSLRPPKPTFRSYLLPLPQVTAPALGSPAASTPAPRLPAPGGLSGACGRGAVGVGGRWLPPRLRREPGSSRRAAGGDGCVEGSLFVGFGIEKRAGVGVYVCVCVYVYMCVFVFCAFRLRRLFLCLGSWWRSVPQGFVPACCCARGQLAELRPLPSAKPDCFSFIQRPVIS